MIPGSLGPGHGAERTMSFHIGYLVSVLVFPCVGVCGYACDCVRTECASVWLTRVWWPRCKNKTDLYIL